MDVDVDVVVCVHTRSVVEVGAAVSNCWFGMQSVTGEQTLLEFNIIIKTINMEGASVRTPKKK